MDAFRDQNAALVERVAQLEGENQELRARLEEEIAARGENREAFVKRLAEENKELHAQLREMREDMARKRADLEREIRNARNDGSTSALFTRLVRSLYRREP
jgi:hypothetical protein